MALIDIGGKSEATIAIDELKDDEGPFADGKLTSDITLSVNRPWDAFGIIFSDHSIKWSNGTKWRKQSP